MVLDQRTDIGTRPTNQDACASQLLPDGKAVIAVADGVTRAGKGGEAARMAAKATLEIVASVAGRWTPQTMREAVEEVNRRLLKADPRGQHQTTLVVLAIDPRVRQGFCAHSGDSWAAYLDPKGESFRKLTRSHGEAARLLREQVAGPLGAQILGGAATRGLGCEQHPPIDVESFPVLPGALFVVATDGLDVLQEREIHGILRGTRPTSAGQKLLERARARGLRDNTTVVVAAVPPHRRPILNLGGRLDWAPALVMLSLLAAVLARDAGLNPGQLPIWPKQSGVTLSVGGETFGSTPSHVSPPRPSPSPLTALPDRFAGNPSASFGDLSRDGVAGVRTEATATVVADAGQRPAPTATATPEPEDTEEDQIQ